ncbi:MAG: pentapeptide repeat-containing protein [Rhodopila sp.]
MTAGGMGSAVGAKPKAAERHGFLAAGVRQMANKKHFEVLKEGHLAWHKWRKQNPHIRPNLRGIDMRGSTLNNYDFSNADFESSIFSGGVLSRCRLSGCNFRTANLAGAKFENSDLPHESPHFDIAAIGAIRPTSVGASAAAVLEQTYGTDGSDAWAV